MGDKRGKWRYQLQSLRKRVWFPRRLPRQLGRHRVWVSPSSYLSYVTHSLEDIHGPLFHALAEVVRPGQAVWDVGANLGVATVAASHLVGPAGRVLSIDANAGLIDRVRRSAAAMRPAGGRVDAIAAAVSDRVGVVTFNLSSYSSATSAIDGFGRFPGVAARQSVVAVSLDWLAEQFGPPDVVKIDVEGAEVLALQGAAGLMQSRRPVFIVEVGHDAADAVTELFNAHGYTMFAMDAPQAGRTPLRRAEGDVMAVPADARLAGFPTNEAASVIN